MGVQCAVCSVHWLNLCAVCSVHWLNLCDRGGRQLSDVVVRLSDWDREIASSVPSRYIAG